MKSVLRATALLSGSSVVSILVGLVSAKVLAVHLGAEGVGYMGLLQSLVALAGLVVGMGVSVGLVRQGANALGREDFATLAALRRAAWLLCWGLGGLASLAIIIFRGPISHWMLGETAHATDAALMSLILMLNLASGVQTSILNTYHRVGKLARYGMLNSLLGAVATLGCIWRWGAAGLVGGLIAGACVQLLVASLLMRGEVDPRLPRPTRAETLAATRSLLRFAGPYAASMLVGSGVQFVLPALVLHQLGAESVGWYRAASAISISYLGFLLTAMSIDYYPRLSSASHSPAELSRLINQQHRFVLLIGAPLVLGTLTLTPILVPIIYSAAFMPAVAILQWQLLGDVFKFTSWTIGTAVVARSSGRTLFLVELAAGVNTLLGAWLGLRLFGLAGLGVGYLATYLIHYALVYAILRHEISLSITARNLAMLAATAVATALIVILHLLGGLALQLPIGIALTAAVGLASLMGLWREVRAEPVSLEV